MPNEITIAAIPLIPSQIARIGLPIPPRNSARTMLRRLPSRMSQAKIVTKRGF